MAKHADIPICLIVFNRPGKTRRLMDVIRSVRPETLVVIADGPRSQVPGDEEKCNDVRRIIRDGVDWPCERIEYFSDTNLGCTPRTISGLDQVFRQFEWAIIFEDDCLPDDSFFPFCEELLVRYRDDSRISMISGNNFHHQPVSTESYYFSRVHNIWGWATWRRCWNNFDPALTHWPRLKERNALADIFENEARAEAWSGLFDYALGANAWDFAWILSCWRQNQLAIVPSQNLVTNIGYDADGTHMREPDHPMAAIARSRMAFPLLHPSDFVANDRADRAYEKLFFPQEEPQEDIDEPPEPELKKFLRLRGLARGILVLFFPKSWKHGSISDRIRLKIRGHRPARKKG